jgi:hypothetical protein
VGFAQAAVPSQPGKGAFHDPSQVCHLEGALPAFCDLQPPPWAPF